MFLEIVNFGAAVNILGFSVIYSGLWNVAVAFFLLL